MGRKEKRHWLLLLVVVLLAIFVGNTLGDLVKDSIPVLGTYARLGMEPTSLEFLDVLGFNFGFHVNVNLAGGLAAILVFLLIRR